MDPGILVPAKNPVFHNRVFILLLITVLTVILNLIGLLAGITVVLPHLFYIPIILAGYWFPRRGILFSVLIALLYGLLIFSFPYAGSDTAIATLSRMAIFVIIGGVVSFLSRRLSESEQQLNDIIEFLPDATFAIDREGRIIAWNRAIEELTGKMKGEMLSCGNYAYSLAFYPERRPMLAGLLMQNEVDIEAKYPAIHYESGNLASEIYLPHFHGGRGAHLRFTARALVDSHGNVTGAIESVRDISDRVMMENALQNTGNRLNTLAGIIRHDISAKLAILYGHLRLGVMKFHDPEVITFIAAIEASANSIKHQVEISREFRDLGTLPPTWVPVQSAFRDASLRLDFGKVAVRAWTERLEIFADPHLSAVFYHLIHNSLKEATGATRIIVTYQVQDEGCVIVVEDDGTGVPDAEKGRLFSKRDEGSGHGLFLTSEILSITGITLRETGTYGKGARFEIFVPSEGYRIEGAES